MKMMILNRIKLMILVLVTSLGLSGCSDFLETPAQGALSEEVLADAAGVEALLIGVYGALDGQAIVSDRAEATDASNWVYGSLAGGDAHKGESIGNTSGYTQISNNNPNPSISFINAKWSAVYEGVSRANAVLRLLDRVEDMSEDEKRLAAAEARFLRGHYYFDLRKMFGRVPWIDETTEDVNQPNDREIWPDIEADFVFAMENLPPTQADAGRVNSWAAAAYLAKTYVYQEKWAEAKELFDDIIANGNTPQGVPYDLIPNFRDNYDPDMEDGNPESVFAIEMVANDGTGTANNANLGLGSAMPYGGPFACCGYFQPTQDLVNSYRTDENGLPLFDSYNDEPVNHDLNVGSTERFTPYQGTLDPRLDWTVGRRGVPYHDWGPSPGIAWTREPQNFGPYKPKKNVYWSYQESQYADFNDWRTGTAINTYIIRFADVLLMAAEAEVEAGSLDQALEYVNRVRRRAANPDGMVSYNLNRHLAAAELDNEADMLSLSGLNSLDWVVREDTESTWVYLGGGAGSISNWLEYEDPNYQIEEYDSFANAEEAWEAIRFERKLELAMEGHRFFDLVRWGVAEEVMNDFFAFEGPFLNITTRNGNFTRGVNEYYPIPQNQIDLSAVDGVPVLQQNPGY